MPDPEQFAETAGLRSSARGPAPAEGVASEHEITLLLQKAHSGDPGALDELTKRVYRDLRAIAGRRLRQRFGANARGLTLQPTALVNETYLKLIRQRKPYENREQFFALATRAMMCVLADYCRRHAAQKRGGGYKRTSLEEAEPLDPQLPGSDEQLAALLEALERLEALDPRKAEVVKLRVLWGLTVEEIAQTLAVGPATIDRDWRFARRWLRKEVGSQHDPGAVSPD